LPARAFAVYRFTWFAVAFALRAPRLHSSGLPRLPVTRLPAHVFFFFAALGRYCLLHASVLRYCTPAALRISRYHHYWFVLLYKRAGWRGHYLSFSAVPPLPRLPPHTCGYYLVSPPLFTTAVLLVARCLTFPRRTCFCATRFTRVWLPSHIPALVLYRSAGSLAFSYHFCAMPRFTVYKRYCRASACSFGLPLPLAACCTLCLHLGYAYAHVCLLISCGFTPSHVTDYTARGYVCDTLTHRTPFTTPTVTIYVYRLPHARTFTCGYVCYPFYVARSRCGCCDLAGLPVYTPVRFAGLLLRLRLVHAFTRRLRFVYAVTRLRLRLLVTFIYVLSRVAFYVCLRSLPRFHCCAG